MALLALSTVVEAGAGGRLRSWATLGAVAAGGLGVCLLLWPGRTLVVATALGGAWLIVDGMGRVLDTVTARSVRAEIVGNVAGVAEALVGVAVIARPVGGLRASAVLFGAGLVVGGLRRVWSAANPAEGRSRGAPVQR